MLKFNQEKIEKLEKELTEFEGWLPFIFEGYIDKLQRDAYLKSVGLYDEIMEVNMFYARLLHRAHEPQKLMQDLVLEFMRDNPQFEGIAEIV